MRINILYSIIVTNPVDIRCLWITCRWYSKHSSQHTILWVRCHSWHIWVINCSGHIWTKIIHISRSVLPHWSACRRHELRAQNAWITVWPLLLLHGILIELNLSCDGIRALHRHSLRRWSRYSRACRIYRPRSWGLTWSIRQWRLGYVRPWPLSLSFCPFFF